MEGRCSLFNSGLKDQRSNALDIEVEIWFLRTRVTPYHMYGLPMECKVPKILSSPSLTTQERGNLYLYTPSKIWGMRGNID
jgi:hypothetical protein